MVTTPAPGMLSLTSAGAAEALAPAAVEGGLRGQARKLLSPAEAKVFDALIEARGSIKRVDLADRLGLSRTASTLGVYLSKIASFGFAEMSGPGAVRLAEWLENAP